MYFPVTALVTLFGNILQNPMDPRARSDTRLMNLVVNFLSMLGQEAETGGVHRMLGVCSEFERIAKVVIDKAEKENSMRRKRKGHDQPAAAAKPAATTASAAATPQASAPVQTPRPATASSATPQPSHPSNSHLSPRMKSEHMSQNGGYSPMGTTMSQNSSPAMAPSGWHTDLTNGGPLDGTNFPSFADLTGFGSIGTAAAMNHPGGAGLQSPPLGSGGMFTQPMMAPDVFTLPMTLDWDWAEMSGGAYPSVENGNFGDPQGR